MKLPKVHGIIATDLDGNIDVGRRPIAFNSTQSVMDLDKAVLREFIRDMFNSHEKPTIVVGEETYRQMGGLLEHGFQKYSLIVTSKDSIMTADWLKQQNTVGTDNPMEDTFCKAFSMATEGRGDIFVFGGRSVYNTFAQHYSRLVHVTIKDHLGDQDSKKVDVFGVYNSREQSKCLVYEHNRFGNTYTYASTDRIKIDEYNPMRTEA